MKQDDYDEEISMKFCETTDNPAYNKVFNEIEIPSFIEVVKAIKGVESANIIDFGCGNGMYTRILRTLTSGEVYGIDLSSAMLVQAQSRENTQERSIVYKIADLNNDICSQINIESSYFDIAICNWVLTYSSTTGDLTIKLSHMNKLIKPGGALLCILVNCYLTPSDLPRTFMKVKVSSSTQSLDKEFLDETKMIYESYLDDNMTNSISFLDTYFSYDTLKQCSLDSGFRQFEVVSMTLPQCDELANIVNYYGMIAIMRK